MAGKITQTTIPSCYHAGCLNEVWKNILQDENVDIISPQFYRPGTDGVTDKGECFVATPKFDAGSFANWKKWTSDGSITAKIMPSIRVNAGSPDSAALNTEFADVIRKIEQKCQTDQDFSVFCDAKKYYLWSSN